MKYGRIENDRVVEVVSWNPEGKYPPDLVWLPVPEAYEDIVDNNFIVINSAISPPSNTYANDIKWGFRREMRDSLLSVSDHTILSDSPLNIVLWKEYRQKLRDVPQDFSNPDSIEWPTPPSE
jgi:hypothetical protein